MPKIRRFQHGKLLPVTGMAARLAELRAKCERKEPLFDDDARASELPQEPMLFRAIGAFAIRSNCTRELSDG